MIDFWSADLECRADLTLIIIDMDRGATAGPARDSAKYLETTPCQYLESVTMFPNLTLDRSQKLVVRAFTLGTVVVSVTLAFVLTETGKSFTTKILTDSAG